MTTGSPHTPVEQQPHTRRGVAGTLRMVGLHGAGTIVAIALLPACLAVGVPFWGWALGAGAVVANRLVHWAVAFAVRDSSPTVVLGAMGFSMILRALFTALALFFVGAELTGTGGDQPLGFGRPDLARSAIIVFILCFTIDAGIETIRRAAQREELVATDAALLAASGGTAA